MMMMMVENERFFEIGGVWDVGVMSVGVESGKRDVFFGFFFFGYDMRSEHDECFGWTFLIFLIV